MAKKKHRRRCRNLGLKLGIGFVVLFALTVGAWVGIDFWKLQKAYEEAEAKRVALMDFSWIDSDYSLSWVVWQGTYEKDEEEEWSFVDDDCLLRTQTFADGTVTDISLDRSAQSIIPSDDERGFVLADWNGESETWTISRLNDANKVEPMFFEVNPDINRILGWYDGKLYGEVDVSVSETGFFTEPEYRLTCWNMDAKTKKQYRGDVLCLEPDGKAVILERYFTGRKEVSGGHTDKNGEWIVDYGDEIGWNLGIEDAQGNWTPITTISPGGRYYDAPYAAWLDDDRLLLVLCDDPERKDSNLLYLYTVSTGELTPWQTQDGDLLRMHLEPSGWFRDGSMTVSPDGRFIAYRTADPYFKGETEILMVQSLETGRACKLCPQDPVVTEEQKIGSEPSSYKDLQVWHKQQKTDRMVGFLLFVRRTGKIKPPVELGVNKET